MAYLAVIKYEATLFNLQVREAQPLIIQSDVMHEEMTSCCQVEYTAKSIPLLLHQVSLKKRKVTLKSRNSGMHALYNYAGCMKVKS